MYCRENSPCDQLCKSDKQVSPKTEKVVWTAFINLKRISEATNDMGTKATLIAGITPKSTINNSEPK